MKFDPMIEANRGKIATMVGSGLLGAIPWIGMQIIKSGEVSTVVVLSAAVFISMAAGALLQWWVK